MRFKAAIDSLMAMPPNEHRAVVAQHLASQLKAAPIYRRTLRVNALAMWGTAQEVPVLIALLADVPVRSTRDG